MKEFKPKFQWSKWEDPFSFNNNEEEGDTPWDKEEKNKFNPPILFNPTLGIIPINKENIPSKYFKLWQLDVNFKITANIFSIINEHNGIETADILTPYRLRLGIGRLFDDDKVKIRLTNKIKKYFLDKNKQNTKIDAKFNNSLQEILRSQYSYWAIAYQSPDGKTYKIVHGTTQAEVEQQLLKIADGTIIKVEKSWQKENE